MGYYTGQIDLVSKHHLKEFVVNRLDNKIWDIEFDPDDKQLSKEESFMNLDLSCEVSALYPAYTIRNELVLRLSNMTDTTIDMHKLAKEDFIPTNALEEVQNNDYQIEPFSMKTFIHKVN